MKAIDPSNPSIPAAGEAAPTRAIWLTVAALIVLLHLFHNGIHIVDREPWIDEGWTYHIAAQPLAKNLTLPITSHAQPPLYYVVLHCLLQLSGAEWFIRGFSWLAILGLLAFIGCFVSELSPSARIFFCAVLVFHDITLYMAQELRPYAWATLATFISTILAARLVQRPGRSAAVAYGAVALLALYTLSFDIWAFACHGVFFATAVAWESSTGWREAFRRHWPSLLSFAIVALLYLPYLVAVLHSQGSVGKPSLAGSLHNVMQATYRNELAYLLGLGYPRILRRMAMAALLLGLYAEVRRGNWAVLMMAAIVFGQIAFVQGFLSGRIVPTPRYYSPVFPLLWFLVTLGFQHLVRRPPKLLWQVVLLVLAYETWALAHPFVKSLQRPVARQNMRLLRDELAAIPGRKVIFFEYGFRGYMFEYEVRNDRDIVIRGKTTEQWVGLPQQYEAETIDSGIIESSIAEETSATCFFYAVEKGRDSLYFSVFVPAMTRRGYEEIPFHAPYVYGFCRPDLPPRQPPGSVSTQFR